MYAPTTIRIWQRDSHFRMGDKHFLLSNSFSKFDLDDIENMNLNPRIKFHIFIGSSKCINNNLYQIVKILYNSPNPSTQVFIHIPKKFYMLNEPVYDLLSEFIQNRYGIMDGSRVIVIRESKGPHFSYEFGPGAIGEFYVNYNILNGIEGYFHMDFRITNGLSGDYLKKYIINPPRKTKDQLIKEFKADTPLGILKSFKDEKDIWDYIKQSGEWGITTKDGKPVAKLDIVMPKDKVTREDQEAYIKFLVRKTLGQI